MPDPRFPFVRPDDLISTMTAGQYNARNAEIERRERLAMGGGIRFSEGPGGRSVSMSRPDSFWAKLTGSANPYAFAEVSLQPNGTWLTVDGGFTGDGTSGGVRAYEVNAVTGLNNKIAWLTPGFPGDYRFQHIAVGSGGPGGPINIPSCFCQGAPASLAITVTYAPGENVHTYGGQYINSAVQYYTNTGGDEPSYGIYYHSGGGSGPTSLPPGYFSVTPWLNDFGRYDFYQITCTGTVYFLSIGEFVPGSSAISPGLVYQWGMGGKTPVNFCNPFGLLVGQTWPGVFFNGTFVGV